MNALGLRGWGRPRLSLRLLALASLGLNLLLGSMLVSAYLHQPGPPPSLPMPDRLVERIAPDLPAADAERLRRAFSGQRARFAALQADYRAAAQRVRAAAARDPVDPADLRARMDEARQARRRIGDLIEETMRSLLPNLSPPARARIVSGGPR